VAGRHLGGVYVANVTPFKEDGTLAVDEGAYLEHVAWLSEGGVRGVVPFGTNGEGPSVAMEEKMRVLEALFGRDLGLQIIPSVMQANLPDTLRMIEFLNGHPAAAVLVLPPYYFKPADAEGLKRFYEPVMEASGHPVVAYHIPKYAVPVPAEVVGSLPFWGVKDSGGEPGYAEAVLGAGKGVLVGTEDDVRSRVGMGAQGAISALANFVPDEVVALFESATSGDEEGGEALAGALLEARAKTKEHSSPAVLKRLAQERHGVPMGTVRPPFLPLPQGYDAGEVLRAARAAGTGGAS
jgi:dihydrodipicolinate synthase/N-acetylneuraminate lyase